MSDLINKAVELLKAEGYKVEAPQKISKADIMKIPNPSKRQQAIAENIDLFVKE